MIHWAMREGAATVWASRPARGRLIASRGQTAGMSESRPLARQGWRRSEQPARPPWARWSWGQIRPPHDLTRGHVLGHAVLAMGEAPWQLEGTIPPPRAGRGGHDAVNEAAAGHSSAQGERWR